MLSAVSEQLLLREDKVRLLDGETVGKAVADENRRPMVAAQAPDDGRLARRAAVFADAGVVRETYPRAIVINFHRAGEKVLAVAQFAVRPRAAQNPPDNVVESVAQNVKRNPGFLGEPVEAREARIQGDGVNQRVQLLRRCANQRHLPLQALARSDHPLHPGRFKLAPAGIGKLLEDAVRHVFLGHRTVKITKHNGLLFCRILRCC